MTKPTNLNGLRALFRATHVRQVEVAKRIGKSEAWFSKIINEHVPMPENFIGDCFEAIREIVEERRQALGEDAK